MDFATILVIGITGLVFLIAIGHVVRCQDGPGAERRFWLRMALLLLGVGVTSFAAYGLLPEAYHGAVSLVIQGASLPMIWYLFVRVEAISSAKKALSRSLLD